MAHAIIHNNINTSLGLFQLGSVCKIYRELPSNSSSSHQVINAVLEDVNWWWWLHWVWQSIPLINIPYLPKDFPTSVLAFSRQWDILKSTWLPWLPPRSRLVTTKWRDPLCPFLPWPWTLGSGLLFCAYPQGWSFPFLPISPHRTTHLSWSP